MLKAVGALKALLPAELLAATVHVCGVPAVREVAGVRPHAPTLVGHPACASERAWLMTTAPPAIDTRSVYAVAPEEGVHRYIGESVLIAPFGCPSTGGGGIAVPAMEKAIGALYALLPAELFARTCHV